MLLTVEIISVIVLSAFLIYFKREKTTTFVKKITSYELFPKIFWGIILGMGFLYFTYWLGVGVFDQIGMINYVKFFHKTIQIHNLYLIIGPFFGIFVGIAIGASTRPFNLRKLFICVFASFIGGIILSIRLYLSVRSGSTQTHQTFDDLLLFTLMFTPLAIGIADRSLFKIIVGSIGGALYYWLLMNFFIGLLGGLGFIFGLFLIPLGIELPEVMDVRKFFKEIFKNK